MASRERLVKWALLLVAAAAMGALGSYQFVWSSIRPALGTRLGMNEWLLGSVFTVWVVCQTLSQFPAGWIRDRYGPRLPMAVATVFIAAGYLGTGYSSEPWQVFLSYGLGGIGAGAGYTVAINTPVKWFSDRRGLATGIVTMAYGGVSVLFIPYVRAGLAGDFAGTLTMLAGTTGGAVLLGVFVLRDPKDDDEDTGGAPETATAYGWREAIRTWQFWLLYVMLVVVNGVGLMLIGKAVSATQHYGLAAVVVTATASAVAISDSAGIVTVGGLSDRFGRVRTLAATITLSGLAIVVTVWAGLAERGLLFVAFLGAAAFFRSPVFSITPALVGEYYGTARSSENYAALYTAKVWGGVGGGFLASVLIATVGWSSVFVGGGLALIAVGLLTTRLEPVDGPPT